MEIIVIESRHARDDYYVDFNKTQELNENGWVKIKRHRVSRKISSTLHFDRLVLSFKQALLRRGPSINCEKKIAESQ